MDSILMIVTGISLALASVMAVLLARMVREERRRSDARVQMLEELAARRAAAAPAADAPVHRPGREAVGVHDLFHEELEPSPWPRRFAVIGGMAAVLAIVFFGWSQSQKADVGPAAATTAAGSTAETAPLELLSLRHSQDDGILTVTGLVQNPRGGASLTRVHATLFVFGPGGTFITSGRAPLDFTTLTPGDESPFVVRVPVTARVERYRVGFRGHDDRVIAHVDRRSADAVAQRAP